MPTKDRCSQASSDNYTNLNYLQTSTQNERAFQRQPTINLNRKSKPTLVKKKKLRLSRDIGLGFKTPREVCGFCLLFIKFITNFFSRAGCRWNLH